jgi:hypothetical protein
MKIKIKKNQINLFVVKKFICSLKTMSLEKWKPYLLDEDYEYLNNAIASPATKNCILLYGTGRNGKTVLIKDITNQLSNHYLCTNISVMNNVNVNYGICCDQLYIG